MNPAVALGWFFVAVLGAYLLHVFKKFREFYTLYYYVHRFHSYQYLPHLFVFHASIYVLITINCRSSKNSCSLRQAIAYIYGMKLQKEGDTNYVELWWALWQTYRYHTCPLAIFSETFQVFFLGLFQFSFCLSKSIFFYHNAWDEHATKNSVCWTLLLKVRKRIFEW